MKFKLVDAYRYQWPVTVELPDPERPGKIIKQKFIGTFEALSRDETIRLQEAYAALTTPAERLEHEHDLLRRVFVGWNEEVVDVGDQPIEFDTGSFEAALQMSWFRTALYRAYQQSIQGEEARRGN